MTDYQQGKIYLIHCSTLDLNYIGSTTETLHRRLGKHKSAYNCYINATSDSYSTSFDVLESKTYTISVLEAYPCNSKRELEERERYFIESMECVNDRIPTRGERCIHDIQRSHCYECDGGAICEHNKRRSRCKTCSPVRCDDCDLTYSKGSIKQHLRSQKHITNNIDNSVTNNITNNYYSSPPLV